MEYYAILSDIHGNLAALQRVAAAARALAAADGARLRFVSLGDVVDYGPQPHECVAWVNRHAHLAIAGNHDEAVLSDGPPLGVDEAHWPILIWTRSALDSTARATLAAWPLKARIGPFAVFHSSLAETNEYINNQRAALSCLFKLETPFGLFGHTHNQGAFFLRRGELQVGIAGPEPAQFTTAEIIGLPLHTWFDLGNPDADADEPQALLNPGSVGQPRRHPLLTAYGIPPDQRACYALIRETAPGHWQARFERVAYPVERTAGRLDRLRWIAPSSIQPADAHPLAQAFAAAHAAMPEQLPLVAARLAAQLRGVKG